MGKPTHFEELLLPHLDAAYNLARWLVRGDQDSQDIVQEAYVRAFKGFAGFRGENPRAWLLTIVRNTAYTWIRKHASDENLIPFDETIHAVAVEAAPSESSQENRRQQLEDALHRLPAEFREVLLLFEFEGWSYKAIAKALSLPLGTVMSRLSRARRRLQEELTQVQPIKEALSSNESRLHNLKFRAVRTHIHANRLFDEEKAPSEKANGLHLPI